LPKEISVIDREQYINTIAEDYLLKGVSNPTKIAKDLGVQRKDVVTMIAEWRAATNTGEVKERAAELLSEMDQSYNKIISELWNSHAGAENAKDEAGILKTIAEVIAKRQEVLQKAGLYDDAAIGDELVMVEEQMNGIKELLKSVARNHPAARKEIQEGLGRIFHQAEPMVISGEVTSGPVA
jgi:hypothetical protein